MSLLLRRWLYALISGMTGLCLAQAAKPKGFSFDPNSGVSNRLITPNGDGRNDFVVFTFSNPRDSNVTGAIYDIYGKYVSAMSAGPGGNTLMWDGRANGVVVSGGVYVYVIQAENTVHTGTVVVVR